MALLGHKCGHRLTEGPRRTGHRCTANTLSTWEMSTYPIAAPPLRVVRTEQTDEWLLAKKGAILNFISSSCTSRKKATGAGPGCEPYPMPRNQSSSCESAGLGGVHTSCPMLAAARESMVVNSRSDSAVAATPEVGSPTKFSSSEAHRVKC